MNKKKVIKKDKVTEKIPKKAVEKEVVEKPEEKKIEAVEKESKNSGLSEEKVKKIINSFLANSDILVNKSGKELVLIGKASKIFRLIIGQGLPRNITIEIFKKDTKFRVSKRPYFLRQKWQGIAKDFFEYVIDTYNELIGENNG